MPDDKNKKGLGRGLMSLFGDQVESDKRGEDFAKKVNPNSSYLLVSIGALNGNRFQPRMYFDERKIDELAISIKKNGLILRIYNYSIHTIHFFFQQIIGSKYNRIVK